jgi:hypothetical protein
VTIINLKGVDYKVVRDRRVPMASSTGIAAFYGFLPLIVGQLGLAAELDAGCPSSLATFASTLTDQLARSNSAIPASNVDNNNVPPLTSSEVSSALGQ